MPHASEAEREAARENLRQLARFLVRVHLRLAREKADREIRTKEGPAVESEDSPPSL
jgi:hypothetical protein